MSRSLLPRVAVLAGLALAACDKTAPAVPFLEPVASPTALDSIILSGVAEGASSLSFSRTPAFVEGDGSVSTWKADPVSGRFAVHMPLLLNMGETETVNTFTVVATDKAGNKSEPATLVVARQARRPEALVVTLESSDISADLGKLFVRIAGTNHEQGVPLAGLTANITVTGYTPAPAATPCVTDDAGRCTVLLEGLTAVGTGKVVVDAAQAGPMGAAHAEVPFMVHAGAASAVAVTLQASIPGAPAPANAITVDSGSDVAVTVDVKDAHMNAVDLSGVVITSTMPGANISGLSILDVQKAGTWIITATAGSPAASGTAELTVLAGPPARMELTLSTGTPKAGEELAATVRVFDAHGNQVSPAMAPAFQSGLPARGADTQEFTVASVDGASVGTVTPKTTGRYTATVTAGTITASAPYQVLPGDPDAMGFAFDLGAIPAGGFLVGQPVPFTYSVKDAFGNETGVPVSITVNAPSAFVVDNRDGTGSINGIAHAGSYTVRAVVPGGAVSAQTEPLVLNPDPGQGFNLTLSTALAAQGGTVLAFVQDGYGNTLPTSAYDFPGLDGSITRDGSKLTFAAQGSFAVTACLVADPSICDTEFIGIQGNVDVTPPSLSVTVVYPQGTSFVPRGGRVSFTVNASDDRALSQLSYVVQYGFGGSCITTGNPLLLPAGTTTTTPPVAFTFTVPTCALPLDRISIVARAQDAAGNANNSAENTTLSVLSQYNTTPATGFTVTTLAYGGNLNVCQDAALEASSGRVLVSNSGSSRGMAIYADRTIATLQDNNGQTVDMQQTPRGVEYDAFNNRTYFAIDQTNRIGSLDQSGTWNGNFITSTAGGGIMTNAIPEGLAWDAGTLCIAFPALRAFQCITIGTGATVPAVRCALTDVVNLSQPAHLALKGADLFVSDRGNGKIHHYSVGTGGTAATNCTYLNSITPSPAVGQLADILVTPAGNLLVADRANANGNGKLVRVDPNTGTATTLVAGFDTPNGLAWSGNGVLVTDEGRTLNEAVFLVTPDPANPGTF